MGFYRKYYCCRAFYWIIIQTNHNSRATTFCLQQDIWLLCGFNIVFPFPGEYRNDHRIVPGNRYSIAIFQLWGIIPLVVHHPPFYLCEAGFFQVFTHIIIEQFPVSQLNYNTVIEIVKFSMNLKSILHRSITTRAPIQMIKTVVFNFPLI